MQDDGIEKLYYSIGEVSDLVELEPHVLRYWETEFEDLHPRKNRAGRRVYTENDIDTVRRIKHLLRVDKYTIEGARQVMAHEPDAEAEDNEALRQTLAELRTFLDELRERIQK